MQARIYGNEFSLLFGISKYNVDEKGYVTKTGSNVIFRLHIVVKILQVSPVQYNVCKLFLFDQ